MNKVFSINNIARIVAVIYVLVTSLSFFALNWSLFDISTGSLVPADGVTFLNIATSWARLFSNLILTGACALIITFIIRKVWDTKRIQA